MVNRAERISKAISDKGLSYTELEKVTGVSKSALQRYATGQTKKIPIDVIEAIAAATGVSARYLMGWDEENAPADKGESVDKLLSESKTLAEWLPIIKGLTRENKIKLFEYAQLLLISQGRDEKSDQ